jgi:hypothetical protein
MAPRIFDILLVAFSVSTANILISSATTAKPFPTYPALGGSIDAINGCKFV